MIRYFPIIILLTICSCERSKDNSILLGDDYARKALSDALADTVDILPVDKVLIESEETAIDFAEVVLFKVYGRETIEDERPYQVRNIDGYWIINGTLPKGYLGGTFEIIFNSKDGQIIRLIHYK
jgi:hypothetical protein